MGLFSSKPDHDILNEKYFSLTLKCVMPMLGAATAEFQVHKPEYVLVKIVTEEGDTVYVVHNNAKKEISSFWTNPQGVLSTENTPGLDRFQPAVIWINSIYDIIESYKNKEPADIKDKEKELGTSKFTCDKGDKKYHFYETNSSLTGLAQERPSDFGLLSYLPAFVESGKILQEGDIMTIPDGLKWQEARE